MIRVCEHALERHRDEPAVRVSAIGLTSLAREAVWTTMLDAVDRVQPNVYRRIGPGLVHAIVDDWKGAFLLALCEPFEDKTSVNLQVTLYGEGAASVEEIRRWVDEIMAAVQAAALAGQGSAIQFPR